MTTTDQYHFGAAPIKQEGGVYYPYPPKVGTVSFVQMVLETAIRVGADQDIPEGSRYIQISETLANQMAEVLALETKGEHDAQ